MFFFIFSFIKDGKQRCKGEIVTVIFGPKRQKNGNTRWREKVKGKRKEKEENKCLMCFIIILKEGKRR